MVEWHSGVHRVDDFEVLRTGMDEWMVWPWCTANVTWI